MEYVFFHAALRDEFAAAAAARGVACTLSDDPSADEDVPALLVAIADDVADEVLEELEERYDELMERQSLDMAATAGWVEKRVAGVTVTLDEGTTRTIRLPPELANRLLEEFSAEEIHDLVAAVARSLAGPEEPRLCQAV